MLVLLRWRSHVLNCHCLVKVSLRLRVETLHRRVLYERSRIGLRGLPDGARRALLRSVAHHQQRGAHAHPVTDGDGDGLLEDMAQGPRCRALRTGRAIGGNDVSGAGPLPSAIRAGQIKMQFDR